MLNSSGYDLVFATDPACNFKLNWDTETVNNTGSAQMNVWVRIPSVSNVTDTVFYACYGNVAITSYQGNSQATWDSNYTMVLHLPNGTVLTSSDSTNSASNATNFGASATTGIVDGAAGFTGGGNGPYLLANSAPAFAYPFTIEGWYKTNSTSFSSEWFFMRELGNNDFVWYEYFTGELRTVVCSGGCANEYQVHWAIPVLDTNWHKIDAVFTNSTSQSLYFDGQLASINSSSGSGATLTAPTITFIGAGDNGGTDANFNGTIDEYRMSTTGRSSDWILTEYNNQSNPSGFIIFDSEVNNTIGSESEKGIVLDGRKMTLKGGRLNVR